MRSSQRHQLQNNYSLAPSPRRVPTSAGLRVLFGGTLNQVGWIAFGLGMIFVWMMFPIEDVIWHVAARDEVETTTGVVTASEATNTAENDVTVYVTSYTFSARDGVAHEDHSYATGRDYSVGTQVRIEYVRDRPSLSRIAGMRRSTFGLAASFVALFPIVGVCLLLPGLRKGLKANRLMRQGRPALAEFVERVKTNMSVNNRAVHKLTYKYTADDGVVYPIEVKTHEVEAFCNNDYKRVLYDPGNPACAVMLEDLSDGLQIDGAGNFQPVGALSLITVMFIPVLSVVGHGYFLYGSYLR
jgi:hypothetical protein